MNLFLILYFGFWIACFVGGILLFIYVLKKRLSERKVEKVKHKDYDKF